MSIRGNLCKNPDNLQLGKSKYITNSRGNGQNNFINVLNDWADVIAVKEMSNKKRPCTVVVLMGEPVFVATSNAVINALTARGLHIAKVDF